MNILFINANLYGHINPTLGLVNELAKRGHQIDYYCSKHFSESVVQMGAAWIGYSYNVEQFLMNYRPTDRHPFYMLMEYMLAYDEAVLPELVKLAKKEKYDFIICDSYFGAAPFLEQLVEIPVVCSHSSFAMSHAPVPADMLKKGFHPQLDHCYDIIHRICKAYKIIEPSIEQIFISKAKRNIVYTTQAFNGDENISAHEYLFCRPSLQNKKESELYNFTATKHRKIIYISLGSVNTNFIDFYKMCIIAFCNTEYYVYMSIGKKCDVSQLGEIPDNFCVNNFLPQLQILKHTDVFITHAGFNSVNEALYFAVPMLALPLVNDQRMVAKRIAALGLGKAQDMTKLTVEELREGTLDLIQNEGIKENCLQMSGEMQRSSGIRETIITLEKFVQEQKE